MQNNEMAIPEMKLSPEQGRQPMGKFEAHIAVSGASEAQVNALIARYSAHQIKHKYFLVPPHNIEETITAHDLDQPQLMFSRYVASLKEAKDLVGIVKTIAEELGIEGINFEIEGLMPLGVKTIAGPDMDVPALFPGYRDTFDGPLDYSDPEHPEGKLPKRPRFESHLKWKIEVGQLLGSDGALDQRKLEEAYARVSSEFVRLFGRDADQIVLFGVKPLTQLGASEKIGVIGTKYHADQAELERFQLALQAQPGDYRSVSEQVLTVIERGDPVPR